MSNYSKYFHLKSTIENVFGMDAWYALKETNDIRIWKKYCLKTISAIGLAIDDSVRIRDDAWQQEIDLEIEYGIKSIEKCNHIDELFSALSAAMISVSFLQIGFMPRRKGSRSKYSLRKGQWKFDHYRSVAYLQTLEQKEILFQDRLRNKLGSDRQQELILEYEYSDSTLSFEKWYFENGYE